MSSPLSLVKSGRRPPSTRFQRGNYGKAASKYSRAVRLLEERRLKDAEEEKKWKAVLLKLYLNQSLCSLRQGKPKLAIVYHIYTHATVVTELVVLLSLASNTTYAARSHLAQSPWYLQLLSLAALYRPRIHCSTLWTEV